MDAYSSYITAISEARTRELRREAAEYALSRAARRRRPSRWLRVRGLLVRPRQPVIGPVAPLPLPVDRGEAELRRSA